ncbi:uncharacterized protein LOC107013301 [Solanum pennellii]|uniref:Uncharacterized protein LOC107013301 n=1 Tax=Solanum pennellii TaxID=28526 RepID=A0ABM1GBL4_SOLPN|nr:uncharacterized protein LOC107013301 [Solanum pennellii]
MKKLKLDWTEAAEQRLNGFNDVDEFFLKAYKSSAIYKEKIQKYHDHRIGKRELVVGDFVLLTNSTIRLFLPKLKSKWTGSFLITKVFPFGEVDLENKEVAKFTVNGYDELRIKTTLQVMMAPKKEVVYAKRGKTKLVALSHRMIEEDSDNE